MTKLKDAIDKKDTGKELEKNKVENDSELKKSVLQVAFRNNIKNIMHYRNIYVFLANTADEILTPNCFSEIEVSYKEN